MSRIRTIKPEFWRHEDLSELPEATHLLAAALLNYADDEGYFNANPMLVKAECSPLREPSVSVPESLRSLQTIGYIRVGTGPDGRRYGHIVKFVEHQRVSHPTPSKISCLSITWDDSGNSPEILRSPPEHFVPEMEQGTGNREQGSITCAMPADADMPPHQNGHAYTPAFEALWADYPPRTGGNSKRAAFKAWQARLREGVDPGVIHAGVQRYAAYLQATGKAGSEFVKQAATFLGPNEHYREPWAAPREPGQVGTASDEDWV